MLRIVSMGRFRPRAVLCAVALTSALLGRACTASTNGAPGASGNNGGPGHDAGKADRSTDSPAPGTGGSNASGGNSGNSGNSGGSSAGGAGGSGTGGNAGAEAGPLCDAGMPPGPTGKTIQVTPPMTLGQALGGAAAGDRIVLHAGTYTREQISNRSFTGYVFIEAAANETVSIPGLVFRSSDHIAIRGVRFTATVQLDASNNFAFRGVTFDGGASEEAALHIHGQGSAGASHDVLVEDSTLLAGGRTVFVLGKFAPSEQWNHHLTFVRNQITCGSRVCFQLSGSRDMQIENNQINGTTTSGVLLAGATRIAITRNRFKGMSGQSQVAMQIASPGMEWDNYAGVENMISSAVVVANNVVDAWATGVQLDAARDIAIVNNTVANGAGVRLNHRTPHDQAGNVILNGNSNVRLWNNILPSISIASGETRPAFESNNLVWMGGGGGMALVTGAPAFTDMVDFRLTPQSPAIDAALTNSETPVVDFDGNARGSSPDIGARELGASPPPCH